MDIFKELYSKSIVENERNLLFWNEYLQNLESLDFSIYNRKLKVPALVPIGRRILFKGELKHTNEVTVALGADYFVKCSLKQADILREHRMKVAQGKLEIYKKEKDYLENQILFTKQNIYEDQGKEIIEYHTEEEDKIWKERHRANVKKYMKNRKKEENQEVNDEDLWTRLEELELQEELENELNNDSLIVPCIIENENNSFIVKDHIRIDDSNPNSLVIKDEVKAMKEVNNMKVFHDPQQSSKLHLLQQVIDKQYELDEKLQDLKYRERSQSKTEIDIFSKLDELEQLDELEDELNRLDDIIANENRELAEESENEISNKSDTKRIERRVSFVDEDDSESVNIYFKHSDVKPNNEVYDPVNGIQKPSDIYKVYQHHFQTGTKSILKKCKYNNYDNSEVLRTPIRGQTEEKYPFQFEKQDPVGQETIVIKDVVEKGDHGKMSTLETETKPASLFKKKRMQNKT